MIEFHTDGSAAIALSGEIDIATVSSISDQVAAALEAVPTEIRLGMSRVTFIDSTGIGALVGASTACTARHIPLVIADPSPSVMRMLDLTGLRGVMTVRPAAG